MLRIFLEERDMDKSVKTAVQPFDPLETLTVPEVAKILHVSPPTVQKYMRLGDLPCVTMGRCRRIRRTAVEDFLQMHTTRDFQSYTPAAMRSQVSCPTEHSADLASGVIPDDFSQGGGDNIPF